MSENFSLKKRVKGLLSLILAIATIVAVFPPIDAQAEEIALQTLVGREPIGSLIDAPVANIPAVSNQDYYYFLTGFDGSSFDVGYFVKTDSSSFIMGSGGAFHFDAMNSGFTASDYNDFISFYRDHGHTVSTLGSVSLNRSGDSGSGTGYLSVDDDADFYFFSLNYVDAVLDYGTENDYWGCCYPGTGYTIDVPAGNYQIAYFVDEDNYDSGNFYYYTMIFSDFVYEGNPFVALMYQQIKDKADEVKLAAQGLNPDGSVNATKTVYYNAPSVSAEIIKALMNTEGVSFVVTYNFAGYEFTSTITSEKAREMYNPEIAWYGPAYIAQYCGATWTGKTVE